MNREIEWRFLVTHLPALPDAPKRLIRQAYISRDPAVRVRLEETHAELTIKLPPAEKSEPGAAGPLERAEFTFPIDRAKAEALFASLPHRIEKMRYTLASGLELDVFHGPLDGLILAELEVEAGAPAPQPPPGWQWRDISRDRRYSNAALAFDGIPEPEA